MRARDNPQRFRPSRFHRLRITGHHVGPYVIYRYMYNTCWDFSQEIEVT